MLDLKFLSIDNFDEFYKLNSFAFTVSREIAVSVSEHLKDVLKDKSVEKLGAFENGVLLSSLIILNTKMNFRNSIVNMGGIGNVCSSPIYRGKGGIKFLMTETFKILKKKKVPVSVLYPFSIEFYRKYGYEILDERKEFSIPSGEIKDFKFKKSVYNLFEYSSLEEMKKDTIEELKNLVKGEYNFILREKEHWKREFTLWMPNDVSKKLIIIYKDDEIKGYILYGLKEKEGQGELIVKEFIFKDEKTKRFIFKTLKDLSLQLSKINIYTPDDFVLWPYVKNYNFVKRRIFNSPMVRIISLEDLNGLKVKGEDLKIAIKVNDKNCEWNNGIFIFELRNGVLNISKKEENPELEVTIGQLSSVLSGFTCFKELIETNMIKADSNYSGQDFKKVTTFINQYF